MTFFNSLQSEWIKRKNSAATWLTLFGGFFIPIIILFSRLIQVNQTILSNSSSGLWEKLFNQCWQYMSLFLLPFGIILAASLICQIEYRNNAWKQVLTTPQSLTTLFFAKYTIVLVMMIAFFAFFTIGIYLTAVVPAIFLEQVPFPSEKFPLNYFINENLTLFIYCLPILAIQYLLSLHIKNFILPLAIGFALLIASIIALSWQHGYIFPYCYASMKFLIQDNKVNPFVNIKHWALVYFFIFSAINYLFFRIKYQNNSFSNISKNKKKEYILVLIYILASVLSIAFLLNEKSSKTEDSNYTVESKIAAVEQNLGAFKINDLKTWTLEQRMKYYKVKGLSIAVVNNFKVEWAKGYGYADSLNTIPVTTNTLFIPGSLSKSVNALGVLKLVQDNKLNLYLDINTYLKTWKFPYDVVSKGKKISALNLLTHTAGLSVHGFYGYKIGDKFPSINQILNGQSPANSEPVKSIFEPNLKMEYSGGGTMILQKIIQDISGKKYDHYMFDNVLKPLTMNESFYTQPPPKNKLKFLATGFDSIGKPLKYQFPIMLEQAAAGLWTTPSDIAKFIIEIQKSLQNNSNKILNEQNTKLMLTPYIDDRSAMGFFIDDNNGYKYFSHEAGNSGFSGAFYGSFEKGNGVVIFINSENDGIIKELGNNVIDVYNWDGFPKKEVKKIVTINKKEASKYVGNYSTVNENGKKIEVTLFFKNNQFWYKSNDKIRKMYFTSKNEFITLESPSTKTFYFDSNQKVLGFKSKYVNVEIDFKKGR